MNRWWSLALGGVIVWSCGASVAKAQFGYQPPYQQQPSVSPFLNLNRFGTAPGLNYYNLVRPQIQTQQQLLNLQNQQGALATAALAGTAVSPLDQPPPLSTTGHPVRYFDWSRYFPLGGIPATGAGVVPGTGGFPGAGPFNGAGVGAGIGFGNPGLRSGLTPGFGIMTR